MGRCRSKINKGQRWHCPPDHLEVQCKKLKGQEHGPCMLQCKGLRPSASATPRNVQAAQLFVQAPSRGGGDRPG
eukprot:99653-Pelagomonas_calceolata.AAC.1